MMIKQSADCSEVNFCCIKYNKLSFKAVIPSLWDTDPPEGSRQ